MALSHINNVALSGLSAINGQTLSGLSEILGQTISAGGGGPVVVAHLSNQEDTSADTGNWALSAVTPTAGRRFIVVFNVSDEDGDGLDPTLSWTVSDGQSLTWSDVGSVYLPTGSYRTGIRVWISTAAAASSTVITLNNGSGGLWKGRVGIYEVGGTDGTIAGLVTDDTAPQDGGYTVTLGATPTADDAVFFTRTFKTGTTSDGGLDMAAGWTIGTNYTAGSPILSPLAIAYNDNLTSTSVVIDDTTLGNDGISGAIDMAFIVKAG